MLGRFAAAAAVIVYAGLSATSVSAAGAAGSFVGTLSGKSIVHQVGERRSRKKSGRVRGYSRGVGGYSYSYADSLLSFDNTKILRDRDAYFDRQAGPFDHGFFFDSGAQARGGDSPYLN